MEKAQRESILKYQKSLKDVLLSLKDGFKQHKTLLLSNLETQKNILNHVCVLGHRILKLTSDPFPRAQWDLEEEHKIRKEFQTKKDQLRSSNSKLDASYKHLQNTCEGIKRALEKIIGPRPRLLCECIYGNSYPILHHIEQYSTYFAFYEGILSHFSDLMAVENMHSILMYKDLLELNEEPMDSLEDAVNKAINEFNK